MGQAISRLNLEKILIVNLAGIGDLVMSSAALRSLREQFPHAYISFLVLSENRDLLRSCPYINEVFVLSNRLNLKNTFGNISNISRLRQERFDIAINLYNLYTVYGAIKMWFLFIAIAAKKTLGRDTDRKGFFYNFKINDSIKSRRHQVERMLDVVKFLGASDSNKEPEVWFSQRAEDNVKQFLRGKNIKDSDIVIGINPGARRLVRRWPLENFAELLNKLNQISNAKIVLTGSDKERPLVQEICDRLNAMPINSCGELGIEDLIVFIKRCNLFITNDTGPAHIANALKRPLIVLAGSGPAVFYPYLKDNCIIIRKSVSCSPCYKYKCRNLDCLKAITPEEVFSAAKKFL
jgi:heptosyltransferase-2